MKQTVGIGIEHFLKLDYLINLWTYLEAASLKYLCWPLFLPLDWNIHFSLKCHHENHFNAENHKTHQSLKQYLSRLHSKGFHNGLFTSESVAVFCSFSEIFTSLFERRLHIWPWSAKRGLLRPSCRNPSVPEYLAVEVVSKFVLWSSGRKRRITTVWIKQINNVDKKVGYSHEKNHQSASDSIQTNQSELIACARFTLVRKVFCPGFSVAGNSAYTLFLRRENMAG